MSQVATASAANSNIVQLAKLRRVAQDNPNAVAKPKVLFVDDEERILNSLRALFRMQYDVTVSTDGYHAIELLKREHFHLLISDQRMPTMQGVELLRRAKEVSPYTVRILLTGFSDLAAIVGSVNDGEVYRYISKPWDSEELKEAISGAVKVGLDLEKLSPLPKKDATSTITDHGIVPETSTPTSTRLVNPVPEAAHHEHDEHDHEQVLKPIAPVMLPESMGKIGVLFLDHDAHLMDIFQESSLLGCHALAARTPEEALQVMQQHEVGVIVASIDGEDHNNVDFLCLLKNEYPHVVSLAVARSGDSETIIGLVNSARVYRVIFHPVRPKVLRHHLMSALKQVEHFQAQPELLKVQQAAPSTQTSSVMANLGSLLKSRLTSIKSFFSRR
ncbi:MAG: hypothetical protein RI964_1440 [Pseudomonadota bacterium]|jgi:serine/threonine-protein kinase